MNCPKCGGEVLNERCSQCGETVPAETLETKEPQAPQYQDYQQSYQPQGDYQAPQNDYQQQGSYAPPPQGPIKHPKSTQNMVIGIIQLVCCCIVTGILMLVWNSSLDTAYRNGDQMECARLEKNIKTAMIIGFIVPVVLGILYGVLFAAGMVGSMGYYY